MTVHFDTLDYANTLEGAGISRAHAEAIAKVQAKALTDLVANDLVTKDFLRSELTQTETRLRGEIAKLGMDLRGESGKLGTDLRGEIALLGTDLRGEMLQMETRIEARIRQEMDALRLQLRSLQYGGAIAAFAISAVVLLSRLIR
jgi:transposase